MSPPKSGNTGIISRGMDFIRKLRYSRELSSTARTNSNCSVFLRNTEQMDALLRGPVLPHVLGATARKIRIVVMGCSFGPEPVTVASLLLSERPDVDFSIDGFDIEERNVSVAQEGLYLQRHLSSWRELPSDFVERTFEKVDSNFRIKDNIRARLSYQVADATSADLPGRIGLADIVFAQHFLYHLPPELSAKAFENIVSLLSPTGALFIDGMDLGLKQKLVKRFNLRPLDYRIEEIHNAARETPWAASWPYNYYGLEPFFRIGDWKTRYATIFVRG